MPSYAGNSLGTATYLSIDAGLKSFTDHVDTIQTDGYYRFNFSTSSSLNLAINGLSANADVSLLDSSGSVITSSSNTGLLAESINTTLQSGTYYIKVSGVSGANTDYNLSVQTSFTTDILLRNTSTGVNAIWGMGGTGRTAVIGGGLITDGNGNVLALSSDYSIVGTADFTGDGIPDILLYNNATGLTAIWGMGGSNNTEVVSGGLVTDGSGTPLALSSDFSIVGIADFTRDGTPDILLYNKATGLSAIWGMGGTNNTQVVGGGLITDGSGTPLALSSSFSLVGIADFNLDGIPDIVLHNSDTGLTAVWGMGGNNNTQVVGGGLVTDGSGTPLALPSTTVLVGIADFNRDGIPDILLRNNVTGLNAIWGMGGSNNTQVIGGGLITDGSGTPLALSSSYVFAAIDDFTQDGIPDILLRNKDTGLNAIWGMGGNGGTAVVSGGLITDGSGTPLALSSSFVFPGTINRALAIDVAGNDTTTAFNVGILNGDGTYTDTVDSSDLDDYYKFTLLSISDVDLFLGGLSGDANVEILDSNGNLVGISTNSGTTSESISLINQVAGTYYARVYSTGDNTSYSLNLIGNSGTPDIISSSLSLTNLSNNPLTSIIVGQQFKVNFNVQNTGTGGSSNISSPFNVAFYISKDATIDTSDYQLHLGSNPAVVGDYTIASLNAGASTGTLTQTLILPPANDPFWDTAGTYYIGMIVDSGDAIGETSETNNSNLGLDVDFATTSVILQDIDLVGGASTFNLTTLSNTPLTSGFAGQQFNANFQIQNTGTTNDNTPFTVSFYLSKDSTIDTSDYQLRLGSNPSQVGDFIISTLAAGAVLNGTQRLILPPLNDPFWNSIPPGNNYYIGIVIDSANTVFETNEANNANVLEGTDYVKAKISQNAVDLVGEVFTVTNPDVSAGDVFDFSFSLKNIGNTATNPFKVAFYISHDQNYSPNDPNDPNYPNYDPSKLDNDRLLSSSINPNETFYYDIISLGANGSSTGVLTLDPQVYGNLILPGIADDFWSKGNGTYYIGIVIDPNLDNPETDGIVGDIDEVDELNNYSKDTANPFPNLDINYAAVNVTGISGIDLKGVSFSAPSSSSVGGSATVNYTITNTGPTAVTDPFFVGFYLSTDATITLDDIFLGSNKITSTSGYTGSKTLSLSASSGVKPGTYYLGMFIDSGNAVNGGDIAETNDSNKIGGVWTVGNNSSQGAGIDYVQITIS